MKARKGHVCSILLYLAYLLLLLVVCPKIDKALYDHGLSMYYLYPWWLEKNIVSPTLCAILIAARGWVNTAVSAARLRIELVLFCVSLALFVWAVIDPYHLLDPFCWVVLIMVSNLCNIVYIAVNLRAQRKTG